MLAWLICHKVAYLDAVFCLLQHMTVHLPGWKLHPICTFGNVAPPEQLNCKVCSGRNEKPHSEGFWVAKHTAHKHPHYPAWEPPGLGLSPVWQQSYLSLHEGFHGCYYQCIAGIGMVFVHHLAKPLQQRLEALSLDCYFHQCYPISWFWQQSATLHSGTRIWRQT